MTISREFLQTYDDGRWDVFADSLLWIFLISRFKLVNCVSNFPISVRPT